VRFYKEAKGFTEASKEGFYYFDIETTGLNPAESKIVSIQFWHLSYTTGTPFVDAKLEILKEWESDERTILEKFIKLFIEGKDRSFFIPVGNNLDFDLPFVEYRVKHYFGNNAHPLYEYLRKITSAQGYDGMLQLRKNVN
jgi:uncharacterized protein YprB with RNaseH-like and TPR domain